VAAFSFTCAGSNAADFNAAASTAGTGATITSYDWAWDDGTLVDGTGVAPSHTFATSGTHHVILTIYTSSGGQNAVSHDVTC